VAVSLLPYLCDDNFSKAVKRPAAHVRLVDPAAADSDKRPILVERPVIEVDRPGDVAAGRADVDLIAGAVDAVDVTPRVDPEVGEHGDAFLVVAVVSGHCWFSQHGQAAWPRRRPSAAVPCLATPTGCRPIKLSKWSNYYYPIMGARPGPSKGKPRPNDVLQSVRAYNSPFVTISDLKPQFEVTRDTLKDRLQTLEERGELKSRDVKTWIWWDPDHISEECSRDRPSSVNQ